MHTTGRLQARGEARARAARGEAAAGKLPLDLRVGATVTREPPARRLPVPGPLAVSLPVPVTVLALARYGISSRHRRGAVTRTLSTVYGYRNFSNLNVQEEGP